ncbi:MAG: cell cycle protein [Firmicutes bacterium]|nr:cell cycle protein [Bacillota bacterium]
MLEQVRAYIRRHRMLTEGDRVVVAVSGGPDSAALLHVLHRLAGEFQVELHVFHMDHALRGDASAADAHYVAELARELGLPCTVVTLKPGFIKGLSGSLQANARSVRYQELNRLAGSIGASRIALGHNRDDQAETVLMRLLRGAGMRGLAGIPPVREQGRVTYIRPLLATPRLEIDHYCRETELSPRLDPSNLKPDYLRNRLRLQLLPHLAQEFNPAIAENLAETAAILREEEALLERLTVESLARCRIPGETEALLTDVLLGEPLALARRVVRLAAREATGSDLEIGLDAVSQVLELAAAARGTRALHLPGGLAVVAEYGICRFVSRVESDQQAPSGEWVITVPGETLVPQLGLRVQATRGTSPAEPMAATFDADLLPGPLALRHRRPGDRISPVGMTGSKKVQDILVDAKVALRVRDRVPLLVAGEAVLWVIGHRLDRRFLATESSRNVVNINVSET